MVDVRSTAAASPATRSSDHPATRASSGVIAALPASPGPRRAPATATSTSSVGNDSIPSPCSSGIEATTTADSRSHTSVTRRGPSRSRSGPPSALKRTSGVISAAATRPVCVAEPVVDRTNHGIAIIEIRVPT